MTSFTDFTCDDLFQFSSVNVDPFTETFGMPFYMYYMSYFDDYCSVSKSCNGNITGYMIGKAEGENELWHGHISAVTISPLYRRMGLAKNLIEWLERQSEKQECYFVDLFVRASNATAIAMYHKLGYVIYRTVLNYYMDLDGTKENAYDMRKALSKDVDKHSMVPVKNPITPDQLEWR
ncbi:hypothetical protein P9112_002118 [Eukaryota sp. TZLM1-RC]